MIDTLKLDCNERWLRDQPDQLINEWILRSSTLQDIINEVEGLILEPGFKRFDSKLLSQYILGDLIDDLTVDDENRMSLLTSFRYMTSLDVTNTYFTSAMDKLFYESPYIVDGHQKIYGEETPFNYVKGLVEVKAAGPVFLEFI